MKIVYCHNYYRHRGGEDVSFESDVEMLRDEGHEVIPFTRDNETIEEGNPLKLAAETLWNRQTYREMQDVLRKEQPDVMHCNNLFPQISVSVYHAARKSGIPVVQALRNYRSFCANSFLYRAGSTCTKCLTSAVPWNALRYRCYRGSLAATSVVVSMQLMHRILRIQRRYVDAFFTPTQFARQIHISGGFNPESIFVRSNFLIPDLGPAGGDAGYALFVGRLSEEKGVETVIDAWQQNNIPIPLRIVGEGPEAQALKQKAQGNAKITLVGMLDTQGVLAELAGARCLIMPSRWYETFGRTIAEAFSRGTPVVASRLGAMAELVDHGTNGYLFTPGDADGLARAILQLTESEPAARQRMRAAARQTFQNRFSRRSSYVQLLQVYAFALRNSQAGISVSHALEAARRVHGEQSPMLPQANP